jgi:hypothetical protein
VAAASSTPVAVRTGERTFGLDAIGTRWEIEAQAPLSHEVPAHPRPDRWPM